MARIRITETTVASVPVPPAGKATIFLDSADSSVKAKMPDGSLISLSTTPEYIQDVFGNFIQDSSTINFTYDDISNTATLEVIQSALDTSLIPNVPSGNLSATNTQAALNELQSSIDSSDAALQAHIVDTVDAHDASAISVVPTGNLSSSNAQAALQELQTDIDNILINAEEVAQDAIANALTDSASVDFIYNDGANTISAVVIPAGVNHNALQNYVANQHIDHSAVNINAGSGLTGGGDITASRTIGMPNVGTPGTYGSATQIPVTTTDTQGRVSGVTNTPIAIPSTQVTDFVEAAQDAVGNALVDTASVDFTYDDAGNQISAVVLPAGVNHNALQNYVANQHVDHSAVNINAGAGLTGGGDITASRTIAMPNVGTPGTYGSASQVPVVTTDTQGRVSGVTNTNIQIAESQVTNLVTDLANKQPLDGDLTALAALSTTGIIARTALNTMVTRAITGTAGNISVTNGDGVSGNPTIDLIDAGTPGTYGAANSVNVITTDAKGRVTSVTPTAINGVPAANITNTAAGNIAATNVQAALNELDSEKAKLDGGNSFVNGMQQLQGVNSTSVALAVTQGYSLIGSTTPVDITGLSAIPIFQIQGTSAVQMAGIQYSNDTIGPVFNLLKSRGGLLAQGLVSNNDEFGRLQFRASDGVNFQAGASIRGLVDGTASAGSMPGRLILMTTPTGSTTPVERMRISQDGLVRVVDNFQSYRRVWDFQTAATANTTTTLTTASAGVQLFTGTVAGQIVRMPDATTLVVGSVYEIRNSASVTLAIQDNAGGALDTTPATSGTTFLLLTANGTAAGTWLVRTRFEPYTQEVSSTSGFALTSTTDVAVTTMTITPPAGQYYVSYTSSCTNTQAANGVTFGCGIYLDTTQQANSYRTYGNGTASFGNVTPGTFAMVTSGTVTVNGSQAINIRARRSAGTTTINTRTLTIIRTG